MMSQTHKQITKRCLLRINTVAEVLDIKRERSWILYIHVSYDSSIRPRLSKSPCTILIVDTDHTCFFFQHQHENYEGASGWKPKRVRKNIPEVRYFKNPSKQSIFRTVSNSNLLTAVVPLPYVETISI